MLLTAKAASGSAGRLMDKVDRLHWEYGKELRISEWRRRIVLASLALNAVLLTVLLWSI